MNAELLKLYWQIGWSILEKQDKHGWGAKVIDRLACDLKREFPGMTGLSPRNLKYMRQFASKYPDFEFVQASLAQSCRVCIERCGKANQYIRIRTYRIHTQKFKGHITSDRGYRKGAAKAGTHKQERICVSTRVLKIIPLCCV